MSITFYTAPWSSASPVQLALAELGVPHEAISLNLQAKEQKKAEFLKLNPNGKVPTLVVDGTPMFEALAIMQWLGDRYGVEKGLWPEPSSKDRLTALSWSTWAYVTMGSHLYRLVLTSSERADPALHSAKHAEQAKNELSALLRILDERLSAQPYLLGAKYSLADLIVVNVVNFGKTVGMPVDGHANVQAWVARCFERPAYKQLYSP
ncbi:MAG TPA: glutathione S-transferase family protein [Polyangiaceae bacterium]|nr:glutathione S-transferase family protein [Polyangiaceae bacterium]